MTSTRTRRTISTGAAALLMVVSSLLAGTTASAATNPYERGPAPTTASISATTGPFATSTTSVSRFAVSGFGGGTIYYPTSTSAGTFGAVVVIPGFTGTQASMSWYGPRVASQGFVVFTIDTLSIYDQPSSRATQLQAALDYLVQRSSVRTRIDAGRLAVMGHSMGGGGTLEESRSHPNLKAAVALMPWDTTTNFSSDRVPTMIIGAQADAIAPVAVHSIPFYNSLPTTPGKAYRELAGAGHLVANSPNTTIAKNAIAWLKRYVDNDTRYTPFVCPPPTELALSASRGTC